jgi:hypothetical protein
MMRLITAWGIGQAALFTQDRGTTIHYNIFSEEDEMIKGTSIHRGLPGLYLFFLVIMILALKATPAQAQEKPDRIVDITGTWHSSTGATIVIPEYIYGVGKSFTIIVTTSSGKEIRYRAEWREGFRQGFIYKTADGDTIYSVVSPDGKEIGLGNSGSTWQATWKR